jgi:putative DNA primase/helicase
VNWTNYDDVIGQMRSIGLLVDGLEVGRMVRCKVDGDREKRGWYSLHELRLDNGDDVLVGSFGVWRGAENNAQKIELKKTALSAEQRAAMKARMAADLQAAEKRRRAESARAALRAQKMWELCLRDGEAAYLKRKGIGAHGVRFSPKGAVVIPVLDTSSRVHGLQVIHAAKRHGRDKEFFPPGMAKKGHFFLMGPQPTTVLLVAEGYATAASLHEASGWPVAVAFDAGNLQPVAQALAKRYKGTKVLVCADDDYLTEGNPGVTAASTAALAVGGAWMAPVFTKDRAGQKITDFNDLHLAEGIHVVRAQVEAKLRQLGWLDAKPASPSTPHQGGGEGDDDGSQLRPIQTVEELLARFALVYEMPETVFDAQEHKLVPLSSMRNLCTSRMTHRAWMESPAKRIVRATEVGFDPAGTDPAIHCNLWGGWPTQPKAGECSELLDLLYFLCSQERNPDEVYQWTLKWLAYPIQYPGTKLKTCLVFHGPQGSGKNMFFEAYKAIFGDYGRIIDQSAVEDKFNDWASRKLFLIADEVVARAELYHIKNKLKGLITGDTIRINPKNVGAYEEANHVNMVILSNEVMPAVLERDDRRHLVVWTPEKMEPARYESIKIETESGGIAALHDFLLHLPLGDFKPWTLPPLTEAKRELIDASMGSSERFVRDWMDKSIPLPVCPCRTEDLFEAFRHWCSRNGTKGPSLGVFAAEAVRRCRGQKDRRRHYIAGSVTTRQSTVMFPQGTDTGLEIKDLSDQIDNFAEAVKKWRDADIKRSGVAA